MRTPYREALITSRSDLEAYAGTLDAYPDARGLVANVKKVAIAPIKSLDMIALDTALVTDWGLATMYGEIYDRSVMLGRWVKNKTGCMERFSQREAPRLALIRAHWDGTVLTYTAPGMPPLMLSPDDLKPRPSGATVMATIVKKDAPYRLVLEGKDGKITNWVRNFLGVDVYALHRPTGFDRIVSERHRCETNARTTLTDGGQYLVTSQASLDWSNDGMAEESPGLDFTPVEMPAIRPNMVLGFPANIEDVVARMVRDDGHEILFGGACVRCEVTQVDQAAGAFRKDKLPLTWWKRHRPSRLPEKEGITFGINCVLPSDTYRRWFLHVGDRFTVTAEK